MARTIDRPAFRAASLRRVLRAVAAPALAALITFSMADSVAAASQGGAPAYSGARAAPSSAPSSSAPSAVA